MWRLALLAVVVFDVSAVRPMGEQHSKNRPSQYQRCRLKTEMGIGDCLELDASAPESSEKFVKVMCQQSGQSFLGPGTTCAEMGFACTMKSATAEENEAPGGDSLGRGIQGQFFMGKCDEIGGFESSASSAYPAFKHQVMPC
ncbi:unnamed protein product [Cladocopium goreaui]|uniref:Uncharacterized protein n=1 Tax=Cladocopium goreaui TaxID=2562237 RepID=A0A9P1CNQ0_9DINO|nr:unnamed protein product [Cladocopium goreaui]CAI3994362.1 unnamed protein product [Cladocopium goreaui]